jgi:hypothetical protein
VATARGARHEDNANPLEHATPDVELAEAQLAVGRPELAGEAPDEPEFSDPELTDDAFDGDAGDDDLAVAPAAVVVAARLWPAAMTVGAGALVAWR